MNKTGFTRAWKYRCSTKHAAQERKEMKREVGKARRRIAKNVIRQGDYDNMTLDNSRKCKLNGWDVI